MEVSTIFEIIILGTLVIGSLFVFRGLEYSNNDIKFVYKKRSSIQKDQLISDLFISSVLIVMVVLNESLIAKGIEYKIVFFSVLAITMFGILKE